MPIPPRRETDDLESCPENAQASSSELWRGFEAPAPYVVHTICG